MRVSDKAVVLQAIRHGDKKCVVKLYTQNHGLVTAIAAVSKSGKVKSATIQALSLIQAELILKQNRDLQQLTETNCYFVSAGFGESMSKLSIAQFMNEILLKTLKEHSANHHLFQFIETNLRYLAEAENNYVNLHLSFLLGLSRYLGFEPQNNYSARNKFFDCRDGVFTTVPLVYPLGLPDNESKQFSQFLNSGILEVQISHQQRQQILDALLAIFKLHVPGFHEVKSLEVLRAISGQ